MFFMLNAGRAFLLPGGGDSDSEGGGQTVTGLLFMGRRQVRLVRGHRLRLVHGPSFLPFVYSLSPLTPNFLPL